MRIIKKLFGWRELHFRDGRVFQEIDLEDATELYGELNFKSVRWHDFPDFEEVIEHYQEEGYEFCKDSEIFYKQIKKKALP